MIGEPTMEYYQSKIVSKKEQFYDGSLRSALLFKARTLSIEVNRRTHRWNDNGSKKCNLDVKESVFHFMAECPNYDQLRDQFFRVQLRTGVKDPTEFCPLEGVRCPWPITEQQKKSFQF